MSQALRVSTQTHRRRIVLALVIAVSLTTAACSATPAANPVASVTPAPSVAASTPAGGTPAPTPTAAASTSAPTPIPTEPLAVVAALVGDDTATVSFSDWNRLRGGAPVPAATDPADRLALILSLQGRAPASGFAMAQFRGHRAAWGWDTLDLAWEATLQADGPPVFVLGLVPGFDLAPLIAHFRDRVFSEVRRGPARVFSRPLDVAAPWVKTTELAIHNTAIFGDARLMVLSSSPEELDRALARLTGAMTPAAPRATAFAAAVAGLGDVDAAIVLLRGEMCASFAPAADPALAAVAATLHPWAALAAGWRTGDAAAVGRFAFVYDDPATASADLAGRARLAREGSTGDGRPLADLVFRLVDARADGALILLDVEPAGGQPVRIVQAYRGSELPFAACG